jgi:1-acyl-sn-glycerol-3-phosphate acyltransferase
MATGFSFVVFGLGAVVLALTLFPLIRCVSRGADTTRRRVQRALHHAFRLFAWMMKSLGILTFEFHDRERLLHPGQLIVANHPSLLDVVFLISLVPEVDCIVKQGLWRNPFLRWPVVWARYIPNHSPQRLIDDCVAALHSGRSLIVFPEGTRSVPGQPLAMKRGAAQIALAANVPIVPVTIICKPSTLTKAESWYNVPMQKPHWRLSVGEAFMPADVVDISEPAPVAARHLTQYFLTYFSSAIGCLPITATGRHGTASAGTAEVL